MMPRAGGQYVYLREAFSPLWGFLYGWTLFLVIQTGTIAAVAVGFARFLGVLVPGISPTTTGLFRRFIFREITRCQSFDAAVGRGSDDRAADLGEHARPAARQDHPERFHLGENVVAARADRAWHCSSARMPTRSPTNFSEHVDAARRFADQIRFIVRCDCVRGERRSGMFDRGLRGAGRLAVFLRRVEQHHVHGRRSEGSAPQLAAVARVRHRPRHHTLSARERRLSLRAAVRADPACAGRSRRHGGDGT